MKSSTGFIASLIALSALCGSARAAQTWYVTGAGDDTHGGTAAASAFRTLKKAERCVRPGDTVLIGDGTYTDADTKDDGAVVSLDVSGKPGAWITWRALPGQHPVIRPTGWNGIIIKASYQVLDGLTVVGDNDAITLLDALKDAQAPTPNPHFNTNGIFVEGRKNAPDAKPHHITIRNCTVGKCAGAGIVAIETDYLTVENCKVYENAWYARYGCSGISTLNNWAFDDAPGYHNIFVHNVVWNNKGLVPWEAIGSLSDGNGIILDVTDLDPQKPSNPNGDTAAASAAAPVPVKPVRPEWTGRSLVAYNLCAYNGGSGIHTFRTRHVDIINNTTYWNGQVVGYPELFANNSVDVNILNNIMVPRPAGKVTSNNRNTGVRFDYNLYPEAQTVLAGPHDVAATPRFVDVEADPTHGSFHLAPGSPGFGSGTVDVPQTGVLPGSRRPASLNRGAY